MDVSFTNEDTYNVLDRSVEDPDALLEMGIISIEVDDTTPKSEYLDFIHILKSSQSLKDKDESGRISCEIHDFFADAYGETHDEVEDPDYDVYKDLQSVLERELGHDKYKEILEEKLEVTKEELLFYKPENGPGGLIGDLAEQLDELITEEDEEGSDYYCEEDVNDGDTTNLI